MRLISRRHSPSEKHPPSKFSLSAHFALSLNCNLIAWFPPFRIKIDCLDQNGDWTVARAYAKPKDPIGHPPAGLLNLNAGPTIECVRDRVDYLCTLAQTRHGGPTPADSEQAPTAMPPSLSDGNISSLWGNITQNAPDPSGAPIEVLDPAQVEAYRWLIEEPHRLHNRRSSGTETGEWLCLRCAAVDTGAGGLCRVCRARNDAPLRLADLVEPPQWPAPAAPSGSHPPALIAQAPPTITQTASTVPDTASSALQLWRHPGRSRSSTYGRIAAALRACTSPFLNYSGKKLPVYFRQFCNLLQEEQAAEHRLAAYHRGVRAGLVKAESGPHDDIGLLAELRQRLPQVMESTFETVPIVALYASAVPITCLWPTSRDKASAGHHSYMQDLANKVIRYQGTQPQAWPADPDALLTTSLYDPLCFVRRFYDFSTATVHFCGFDSRFDERIETCSARLAPYRTHTARAVTVRTQALSELLIRTQDELSGVATARHTQSLANLQHPFDLPVGAAQGSDRISAQRRRDEVFRVTHFRERAEEKRSVPIIAPPELKREHSAEGQAGKRQRMEYVEFNVRCLWLMSRPGGGVLRYRAPSTTPLSLIVQDYCAVQRLSVGQVRACRLDMTQCMRYVYERRTSAALRREVEWALPPLLGQSGELPGVYLLNSLLSLGELGVAQGSFIDFVWCT
jgi:hypothetical protein